MCATERVSNSVMTMMMGCYPIAFVLVDLRDTINPYIYS